MQLVCNTAGLQQKINKAAVCYVSTKPSQMVKKFTHKPPLLGSWTAVPGFSWVIFGSKNLCYQVCPCILAQINRVVIAQLCDRRHGVAWHCGDDSTQEMRSERLPQKTFKRHCKRLQPPRAAQKKKKSKKEHANTRRNTRGGGGWDRCTLMNKCEGEHVQRDDVIIRHSGRRLPHACHTRFPSRGYALSCISSPVA